MKTVIFSVRTPEYTIIREPLEGEIPEFLVMEVKLPGIVSVLMHVANHLE